MSKRVGVLVVHGAGEHKQGYADKFIGKICKHLGNAADQVAFEEAYWHHKLQPLQDDLMQRMGEGKMRWKGLRRFVVNHFGDVVAYQGVPYKEPETYDSVHGYISESLASLQDKLVDPSCPLIVVAFSMGATIISDHIWDKQQKRFPRGTSSFESMQSLCGLFTIGASLPIVALSIDDIDNIRPIAFPSPSLEADFPSAWKNIYDPDDVLGYPLKILPGYEDIENLEDVIVNAGGLLKSWNPFSHTQYINGPRKVVRQVAGFVEKVLKYGNPPAQRPARKPDSVTPAVPA